MSQPGRGREPNEIPVPLRLFLHDDGIGAVRHRRPGKNPHRLACADRTGKPSPSLRHADHLEPNALRHIRRPHGIAIHGTGIKWRLVMARDHRRRQHPPRRFGQRNTLANHIRHPRQNAIQRFINRQQCHDSLR
ncbi:hypothetical protein JP75_23175 [Devosia riboflavina]|uniref:Uncharacterized protein n=1 Tax=Devosia riboflavina TaxID=46914 RepID=A0A087LWT6_9HYPH|nr:hypothetical protein JP75_23175 [Devosia riboflavina]